MWCLRLKNFRPFLSLQENLRSDANFVMEGGQVETCKHWFGDQCLGMGWTWPWEELYLEGLCWHKKTANSVFFHCFLLFSFSYCFLFFFNVCLVLCRGSEATSKTYRNPKQPCINDSMFDVAYKFSLAIVRDVQGVVHQQHARICWIMLNQQEGFGRADSREVMDIPCWGVANFRLGQSRGIRNIMKLVCWI